ncbi:hypothetical protein H0H92_003606 [Tricholoma furcatifolium]|nr:hypothetical protein H0H92_003606 [Tricholoma furcatifolium]
MVQIQGVLLFRFPPERLIKVLLDLGDGKSGLKNAERYLDVTPEERARRRQRGWGNEEMEEHNAAGSSQTNPFPVPTLQVDSTTPPSNSHAPLHIQTEHLHPNGSTIRRPDPSPPLPILPFLSQRIAPTHLKINQFGSRFLPHTTAPIRCLLPLESDKMLLIGHDEGLSVLDMFPEERSEDGSLLIKGPDESQARSIWSGESVVQMSLLEVEPTADGVQGVVLALVGSEDADSNRSLRMYNLASLISLAKWAIAQKGRPLDLRRPSNWQVQQSPSKRPRPQSTIARGIKSLMIEPPVTHDPSASFLSIDTLPSPDSAVPISERQKLSPKRRDTADSTWDLVEDLPLRWATDFVPLATNGSRLLNSSVISYALWKDETRQGRGGRLLAIATKNNILLYETPKGERAFRFVKVCPVGLMYEANSFIAMQEFYTPLQPRSLSFFQQSVHEMTRSASDMGSSRFFPSHRRSESTSTIRANDSSRATTSATLLNYGTHLSLFVIFDKKAGWIRIADSAVGEIELYGVGSQNRASDASSTSSRRSRMSFDVAHQTPKWITPIPCTIPIPQEPGVMREVMLVTRGIHTHIVPSPLLVGPSAYPPLSVVTWRSPPTSISARISTDNNTSKPFLQLIGLGGNGIEVQEISTSFLGKGKAVHIDEPLQAEEDLGGETGFLCNGGHWDQSHHLFHRQRLSRSFSAVSANSSISMDTEYMAEKLKKEEGIYAWCRKGFEDWRVLWLGGPLTGAVEEEDDADG